MQTILVVDDEPTIRALVRATLERAGYRVLEAADGAGALETARSQRPDLILLDVALPDRSGLQVRQQLRKERSTAATPILLLSGLVEQATCRSASQIPAREYIQKPFSMAALLNQVAEALSGRASSAVR